MTAILVTGSRSLATIPGTRDWCEKILGEAIESGTTIVTGDAEGPDAWAIAVAARYAVPWRRWQLNGLIHGSNGDVVRWCTHEEMRARRDALGRRFPLWRDESMVTSVAHRDPYALVFAFIDPASRTHGAEYTAKYAERSELYVTRWVWAQ